MGFAEELTRLNLQYPLQRDYMSRSGYLQYSKFIEAQSQHNRSLVDFAKKLVSAAELGKEVSRLREEVSRLEEELERIKLREDVEFFRQLFAGSYDLKKDFISFVYTDNSSFPNIWHSISQGSHSAPLVLSEWQRIYDSLPEHRKTDRVKNLLQNLEKMAEKE